MIRFRHGSNSEFQSTDNVFSRVLNQYDFDMLC